jgi:hypothetical protein
MTVKVPDHDLQLLVHNDFILLSCCLDLAVPNDHACGASATSGVKIIWNEYATPEKNRSEHVSYACLLICATFGGIWHDLVRFYMVLFDFTWDGLLQSWGGAPRGSKLLYPQTPHVGMMGGAYWLPKWQCGHTRQATGAQSCKENMTMTWLGIWRKVWRLGPEPGYRALKWENHMKWIWNACQSA